MNQIIIGQAGCTKCKTLSMAHPDVKYVELEPAVLMALARACNITSLPIVLSTGDPTVLDALLNNNTGLTTME